MSPIWRMRISPSRGGWTERAAGDLTLNVGRGEGVSVRELAEVIGEVTGHGLKPVVEARRAGDAPKAVASAARITEELGWTARRDVREMVESAWEGWCLRHPEARDERRP